MPKAKNKKPSPKRKSTVRREKKAKLSKYLNFLMPALAFVMILIGSGYYLGMSSKSSTPDHDTKKSRDTTKHKTKKADTSKMFMKISSKPKQKVVSDEAGFGIMDMIEKLRKHKAEEMAREHSKSKAKLLHRKGDEPKLVIIIDDVSQARQLKAIRSLGYAVTPSIFPPTRMNEHSYLLAKGLRHFMIHLPMQSHDAKMNSIQGMLWVSDSDSKMRARAAQIRKLFPTARYVNNHVGSVFTRNYNAMKRMYGYLRRQGFIFVDSRTTGRSKVRQIAHQFGDTYISRDIFIDNIQNVAYIHNQLKKAVKIAKKRGYAIAIGHPHRATLQALRSAGSILKGVKPIYIDQLYR